MKLLTETDIAIVYFSGLVISLVSGILIIIYIGPIGNVMKKIFGRFHLIWHSSFTTTMLIAGILGALSVYFKDCDGSYEYLLNSRPQTIMKGADQISKSYLYMMIIGILWFIILLVLFMKISHSSSNHSVENQDGLQN